MAFLCPAEPTLSMDVAHESPLPHVPSNTGLKPKGVKQSMDMEGPSYFCDYIDNSTALFTAIEEKRWDDIDKFLDTGSWPYALFSDRDSPKKQAQTVICHYQASEGHANLCWDCLPLQLAVITGVPIGTLRRLVDAYPYSVRWANKKGELAIHMALLHNAADDIVAFLISQYPESLTVAANDGVTPIKAALTAANKSRGMMITVFLHHFNKKKSSSDAVEAPPKALTCDYEKNCSKLFKAIEMNEWGAINKFFASGSLSLLGLFPDLDTPHDQAMTWVVRRDVHGTVRWFQLPLHMAIAMKAPFPVLSKLLDLYPKAALCPDDKGMLPIHLAMKHNACDEIVAKLLLASPESVNMQSHPSNGRLTPLDCALGANGSTMRGKIIEYFVTKSAPKKTIKKKVVKG